jgi:hypothetical protein
LRAFDTSSIIHAWDHYPLKQFPGLWNWLGTEFHGGRFTISDTVDAETIKRDADCRAWLHSQGVSIIPTTQAILTEALKIKATLGIVTDRDYTTGVRENDILIIATCVVDSMELVTNENVQNDLPKNRRKYKIPAVCAMAGVDVSTMSFRELIVQSGKVF